MTLQGRSSLSETEDRGGRRCLLRRREGGAGDASENRRRCGGPAHPLVMLWTHTWRMDSSTQKRGEDGWFLDWLRVIMVKLMIMMLKKRRRGEGDCEGRKEEMG